MDSVAKSLIELFQAYGFNETAAVALCQLVMLIAVLLLSWLASMSVRKVILVGVRKAVLKTRTAWDDILLEKGFFRRLSHFAPGVVFYYSAPLFPVSQPELAAMAVAYMGWIGLLVFGAFLDAAVDIYQTYPMASFRPIRGYVQAVKIFVYILGGIAIFATLLDKEPWGLLSGIGAMTAVILLVFKDTILGLVASIQLSVNDMVRIGDWIEMEKYGADGDVIDVSIQCVKVQNWDKTITTIPTYALISDSFKNWRGMREAGGRRIMRALYIDQHSVKFCTPEMIDRFRQFRYLAEYLDQKMAEVDQYNRRLGVDPERNPVDSRRLTNLGTFRAYVTGYIRHHSETRSDLTLMVRQLPPSEKGLPLQIYLFSKEIRWVQFEGIQADIFDHMLAVLPEFELRVFQNPSGADFRRFAEMAR